MTLSLRRIGGHVTRVRYKGQSKAVPTNSKILVVLRASGVNFDISRYLENFSEIRPDAAWRRGDRRSPRSKKTRAESGLNVTLFSAPKEELVELLTEWLAHHRKAIQALPKYRAFGALDLALMVGAEQMNASVDLEPSMLLALSKLGIGLSVSAYAWSDTPAVVS